LPTAQVYTCSGPCGTNSKMIELDLGTPSWCRAKSPARGSCLLTSQSCELTDQLSVNHNLTEFQWVKKQLHGPDYWPTWPSVAKWLMPRSRAAGLQYDQKVNNKLGLFCGKRSIEITTAGIRAPSRSDDPKSIIVSGTLPSNRAEAITIRRNLAPRC